MAYRSYYLKSGRVFLLFSIIGMLYFSCAKTISLSPDPPVTPSAPLNTPSPAIPVSNPNIDFQYLTGWWYSTDITKPDGIPIRYFGPDSIYFFNSVSVGGCATTGGWKSVHDTLK